MSSLNGINNAKIRDARKIKLKCINCDIEYEITYGRFRRLGEQFKHRCKNCSAKSWYNDKSEEEKKNHNDKISNAWKTKSEEEKENIKQSKRDLWKLKSNHERKMHASVSSNNMYDYWINISDDERERRKDKSSIIFKIYRENCSEEDKKIISDKISKSSQRMWENMTDEEFRYRQEMTSKLIHQWWNSATKNQLKERSKKLSVAAKKQWENMTLEEYQEWNRKRALGFNKYLNNLGKSPNANEYSFINILKINGIEYDYQYYNTIKHPDFDTIFPFNTVTKSPFVSPYHAWDFRLMLNDGIVLVDVDGSIHDTSKSNFEVTYHNGHKFILSDYIGFNDSQRLYQTDGFDAYIIQCHDDNLNSTTPVMNLTTNKYQTLDQFMALIQLMNMSKKDKRY